MVTMTLSPGSALEDVIKQYLEKRGDKVTESVEVPGKAGAEHTFGRLVRH